MKQEKMFAFACWFLHGWFPRKFLFCTYNISLVWWEINFRSSRWICSVKKCVLKNFAISLGKQLCQSLFFNNVIGLRPATSSKKRLLHRCFSVNFAKFLRAPFVQDTSGDIFSGRLLLKLQRLYILFNSERLLLKLQALYLELIKRRSKVQE